MKTKTHDDLLSDIARLDRRIDLITENFVDRVRTLETKMRAAQLKIKIFDSMLGNDYVFLDSDERSFYDENYLSFLKKEGFEEIACSSYYERLTGKESKLYVKKSKKK